MKEQMVRGTSQCSIAYRTTPRRATGESPFNLYFGVKGLIPAEVGINSLRSEAFDENLNDQLMEESLALLDELHARIV